MTDYSVISILDLLESVGENGVTDILSGFSCPKNQEIENFLLKNAIEFAKRKMSITHLVIDEQQQLIGYFTLTHKSALVPVDKLSKTGQKKLAMHGRFDEASNCYDVSAFLLAQFGKNYSVQNGTSISGNLLMDYVFRILFKAQHLIGGGVVFLECEEKDKLLEFYQNDNNCFKLYGERFSEKEQRKYLQLLSFF